MMKRSAIEVAEEVGVGEELTDTYLCQHLNPHNSPACQ